MAMVMVTAMARKDGEDDEKGSQELRGMNIRKTTMAQ